MHSAFPLGTQTSDEVRRYVSSGGTDVPQQVPVLVSRDFNHLADDLSIFQGFASAAGGR